MSKIVEVNLHLLFSAPLRMYEITNLWAQLTEEVGHRLSVDVSSGRGQWRVDISVGVDPHDSKLPDCCRVTVDGANRQTDEQMSENRVLMFM